MARKPTQVSAGERITLRVTADISKRAAALVPAMAKDAALMGFTRVAPSTVLKRALEEGLRVLEERYRPSRRS